MTDKDDLDECWCCGGLHDSFKALCPACDDAGCKHFGGECQSDHKPVMPDGGRAQDGRRTTHRLVELLLTGLIMAFGVIVSTFVIAWGFGAL